MLIQLYENNAGHLFMIDETSNGFAGFDIFHDTQDFLKDSDAMVEGDTADWTMERIVNAGSKFFDGLTLVAENNGGHVVTFYRYRMGKSAHSYTGIK